MLYSSADLVLICVISCFQINTSAFDNVAKKKKFLLQITYHSNTIIFIIFLKGKRNGFIAAVLLHIQNNQNYLHLILTDVYT